MRCEFFGDIRDVFKYDLASEVARELQLRFLFIPILTPDENKGHGKKRDYGAAIKEGRPGTKNERLLEILRESRDSSQRCIRNIRTFFLESKINFDLYGHAQHGDGAYFTNTERQAYFDACSKLPLESSLVFLDPDTGLEILSPRKDTKDQYLLYRERDQLYQALPSTSVLMVFQFFHQAGNALARRCAQYAEAYQSMVHHINDDAVAFFFVTKDAATAKRIASILHEYHLRYEKTTSL